MQKTATHIELRSNRASEDLAFIEGTRVRVQDVAMLAELQGFTATEIAQALPHLTLGQIHAALSYYFDHRAEIQAQLRSEQEFIRQARSARGAGVLEQRLNSMMGSNADSVSSR